jgi:glycerate dehydrogenase
MPKIVVLDGHALNPGDLEWGALGKLGELTVHSRTTETEILARAFDAEVLFTNKTPLTAATLAQLPQLRYVGVMATGYNVVDAKAAAARRVVVTNIPTYGTDSVAQFAIALLLELCHRVGLHDQAARMGEWTRNPDWSMPKSPLVELSGKTMGIVGFGRIGRQTAKIADALGMRVIAAETNRVDAPEWPGFRWCGVEELLADSDVVSLHCPLFPETQGLINAQRLALMRRTAFLINTSRGPLVVERDLADALNLEWLAGAALDVLSVEPPVGGSFLFGAKNCIVTPHIAWATREARSRLMDEAVANLAAFLEGKPVNVVS